MRILIIEDEPICSLILTKCLQSVGEIHTASDGQAGLETVQAAFRDGRPYDLICLDIMMPKLDGQTVLKEIRALEDEHRVVKGREARIIMTTALSDQQNLVEAIPRCDAFLSKPIDRGDLMFYVKKFGFLDAPANGSQEQGRGVRFRRE